MHVCSCAREAGGQHCVPSASMRQGFSLAWRSPILLDWLASDPWDTPSPISTWLGSCIKAWGSHLGPLASKASTLLTEPFSQPWLMFLFPENGRLGIPPPLFPFCLTTAQHRQMCSLSTLPLPGCSLTLTQTQTLNPKP